MDYMTVFPFTLIVKFFYQPFFNLLIGIYFLMDKYTNGNADMGIAVILFTIAFRIIWLPISLSSNRSLKDQKAVSATIAEIKARNPHDPIAEKQQIREAMRGNRKVVISSAIDVFFQALIVFMLWRIFAYGLEGADFHLIYSFMPKIDKPFNLMFLGKYDLSQPNMTLNIIQTLAIFLYETVIAIFSLSANRKEMVRTQLVLPVVSFFIFLFLPAGKKLFIITTLLFSICQKLLIEAFNALKSLGASVNNFGQRAAGITASPDPSPEPTNIPSDPSSSQQ